MWYRMNDNPNLTLLRMAAKESQVAEARIAGIQAADINSHEWDGLVSVAGGYLFLTEAGRDALKAAR